MKEKKKKIGCFGFLLLLVLFFLVLAITLLAVDHFYFAERIYPGVTLEKRNLGGLTKYELEELIKKEFLLLLDQKHIHFYEKDSGKSLISASLADVGVEADWNNVFEDAFNIGRMNSVWEIFSSPMRKRYELFFSKHDIIISIRLNEEKNEAVFQELAEFVLEEPRNASFALTETGSLVIIDAEPGLQLDYDKTRKNILNAVEPMVWEKEKGMLFRVEPATRPLEAELTVADIENYRFDNIKASYTTSFRGSDENRTHNIKLAAKEVHNTFLLPGNTFSFNETVGRANYEAGYLEATVIIDGDFATGVGGGICQVSTTLFNAVFIAGMEITERHLHSKPVSYVDPGDDATVSYPYKDLKFKNTLDYPVIIGIVFEDNMITVNIHGR